MKPDPSEINRILVVKLAGIGDLLTAFPALEALRERYKHAEITALVTPQTASLLHGSDLVDRVMVLDKYLFDDPRGAAGFGQIGRLLRLRSELRRRRFDAAVLFHHLITWPGVVKYSLLMMATGARWRAGLDDGRGRFLNLAARDRGFGVSHEVEYWLQVVGTLGAENPNPRMQLSWGDEEEQFAARGWAENGLEGSEVVALHPGTGVYSPARRWAPERFSAVAEALASEGLVPVVIAGPGEEQLAARVSDGISTRSVLLQDVPTPRHLAALLSRCRLFVGNDSGVMHLAVAAGIPVVAIFGLSNPWAWGPFDPGGARSRVVRVDLPCSPCLYRGQSLGLRYGCGDPRCLDLVTTRMVLEAARELLALPPKK